MSRGNCQFSRAKRRRAVAWAVLAAALGLGGALLDGLLISSAVARDRGDRGDRGGGWKSRDRDDDDQRQSYQGGWGGSNGGGWNGGGNNSSGSSGGVSSGNAPSASQSPTTNLNTPASQSQDQSGRGDKREADDNGQKPSAKSAPAAADAYDDGPPKTMLELFKRAFQAPPAPPPAAEPKPSSVGHHQSPQPVDHHKWQAVVHREQKGDKGRDRDKATGIASEVVSGRSAVSVAAGLAAASAAKPKVRLPGALSPVAVPDLSAINPKVLLGVEVNAASLKRLRDLGFKDGRSFEVALGRVTEFMVPETYDATTARAYLSNEMPGQPFTYSVRYHLVPETDGRARPSAAPDQAVSMGKVLRSCDADRCYGAQLLSWQPQLSSCSRGVKVGIVDTAVDIEHPALQGMRSKLGSFGSGSVASERVWHGTGVAALLAGAPESATPGLIPNAEFLLADIFSTGEDGMPESDTVGLLRALEWLERLGANVVNLSISGVRDEMVEPVIEAMAKRGVIFVAAAGNDGPNGKPSFPAAYRDVIAVTAVNKDRIGYWNANRGEYIDVAAPGVGIWTALPNRRMGYRTGTSFAVPFVTSVVATLYASTRVKSKPALLRRLDIEDLGPKGRDPIYGRGLVVAPKDCAPAVTLPTASLRPKVEKVSAVGTPR